MGGIYSFGPFAKPANDAVTTWFGDGDVVPGLDEGEEDERRCCDEWHRNKFDCDQSYRDITNDMCGIMEWDVRPLTVIMRRRPIS